MHEVAEQGILLVLLGERRSGHESVDFPVSAALAIFVVAHGVQYSVGTLQQQVA